MAFAATQHPESKLFRPTTLDAALELISDLRKSNDAAQETVARVRWNEGRDFSEEIDDLIQVRAAIKAGRTDDALYVLEKLLSTLDSGWGCRA